MNSDWVADAEITAHFGKNPNNTQQQNAGCKLVSAIYEAEVCKGAAGCLPMPGWVDMLVLASQQAITNVSHTKVYQWTSKAWPKGSPWTPRL